jgi:hypothetical protein
MDKATKLNLTALVIVGLVVFVIGVASGIFYQTKKDSPQQANTVAMQTSIKSVTSKVVPSILAYGQVTDIDGRNLTLSYGGDNVIIAINDNATITSLIKDSKSASGQQKIDFSQIKNGDTLNVSVKLLPTGQLQGKSIIILK